MERAFTGDSFNQFLKEEKLMGTKCKKCGHVSFPPRADCIKCLSPDFEWIETNGQGTLQQASCLAGVAVAQEVRAELRAGVTDHRVGLTVHQLPAILEGELDPLIEPLSAHFDAERMRQATAREPEVLVEAARAHCPAVGRDGLRRLRRRGLERRRGAWRDVPDVGGDRSCDSARSTTVLDGGRPAARPVGGDPSGH